MYCKTQAAISYIYTGSENPLQKTKVFENMGFDMKHDLTYNKFLGGGRSWFGNISFMSLTCLCENWSYCKKLEC